MPISYVYLKRNDAVKFVKKSYRKGIKHFVRGGSFLYTQLGTGETSHDARGYDLTCLIEVSQKSALKYIVDMIDDSFDAKGVKIKIGITTNDAGEFDGSCIFIG